MWNQVLHKWKKIKIEEDKSNENQTSKLFGAKKVSM